MNQESIQAMQACAQGALSGTLNFPEIVDRLARIGVERYHADYTRQEITYYLSDGESQVVNTPHDSHSIALVFHPRRSRQRFAKASATNTPIGTLSARRWQLDA